MVADEVDYVLGVDTHRDKHMLAAVTAPTGAVVAGVEVSADARGYRATLRFAARYAPGRRVWAIEGSGSYGARPRALSGRARRDRARGQPHAEGRTPAARQG